MKDLIDCAWLDAHLNDADLRVLDCTVNFQLAESGEIMMLSGHDDWQREHIPGSQFADVLGALSNTDSPHQFTLPDAEHFARAMEAIGVGDDTKVVVYDSTFTMWATRVWWMLHAFGFERVAVLNGGLTAWKDYGGAVTNETTAPQPASFSAALRPGWFVDKAAIHGIVDAPDSACLIDALMAPMYQGETCPYSRPGHIPGAVNIPAVGVVDPDTRLFIDDGAVREQFADALKDLDKPVVTYCGGGIAATADAFLLRQAGHRNVAVYDGSMAEWTADPEAPLAMGDTP